MMEKVLLIGIDGVYNYGCEAIVRGTVEILKAVPKTRVMKRYMSHWMPAYIYHHLWRKPYQSPPPNQACHKVRHREYGGKTNTFLQYYTNSNAFA